MGRRYATVLVLLALVVGAGLGGYALGWLGEDDESSSEPAVALVLDDEQIAWCARNHVRVLLTAWNLGLLPDPFVAEHEVATVLAQRCRLKLIPGCSLEGDLIYEAWVTDVLGVPIADEPQQGSAGGGEYDPEPPPDLARACRVGYGGR